MQSKGKTYNILVLAEKINENGNRISSYTHYSPCRI